ncbi:MAG: FtsX-like permease family protein [Bacillota bacterium]
MSLLLKKIFRDIREAKGQFISILLVIIIGVAFFTCLNSALRNLEFASEKYFTAYRLADLWASFQRAPESVLNRIKNFPGVKQVTGRVVSDVLITIDRQNAVIRLITLPDRRSATVNDVMLKAGRYFSDDESNQCLVDESFFKAHRLRFGSYLQPVINGNRIKLKVIGMTKSPEYIYQLRDGSEMLPDPEKFGIVYLKKSFGQAILGFNGSLNDASILLEKGIDGEIVQRRMEKALHRYGLIEIIPKKDQLSYNTFAGEIVQLKSISGFFPILFLIVAAAIIYITMNRIIENQRVQIGTLKALGYSSLQITIHYLSYAFLIGLAGSVIGSLFGLYLGKQIMLMYNTMYQLPLEQLKSHYDLVIPASLLALFFCGLAGYNACKNELRLAPAESMRPKAPKIGSKTWLEQVNWLWRRFNFSWKIIIRNLFRYKKRAMLTSVGIIFATALLVTGLGMNDAIGYLLKQQYSTIQRYDLKVGFNRMLAPSELSYIRNLPNVSALEPVIGFGVELTNGWRSKKLGLTGLIREPRLYQVTNEEGAVVTVPEKGILISNKLSRTLDAGPGDVLQVRPLWPGRNSDRDRKQVLVKGVVAQYIGQNAYGNLDFCGMLLGEGPVVNQVMLKLDQPGLQAKVISKLKTIPMVSSVQSRTDALTNFEKALGNVSSSIVIMLLASGLLAFAVVYNITTINIFERRRELATLKVLGFTNSELRQLIFYENLIITSLAAGCGLLLGHYLFDILSREMATDNMSLPAIINAPSFGLAVILIFIFTISANLILLKKLYAINMVEALKSSE